jgi:large subunit ribosomal protein L19
MAPTKDQQKVISPVDVDKRQDIDIQTGDTVRVVEKVGDGDGDYRLESFEGIVLGRKHGDEPGGTFTVRSEVEGVGVEKIFPLYSPRIDEINIVRRAQMRRSKLYHIRDKAARQIRRQMRRMVNVDISTKTEDEEGGESEGAQQNEEGEDADESADDSPEDNAKTEQDDSSQEKSDGEDENKGERLDDEDNEEEG